MYSESMPFKSGVALFFLFALASFFSLQSGLDQWVADAIYTFEGGVGKGFPLRHNFWLETIVHDGGRMLVKRLWFLNLLLLIFSFFVKSLRRHRWAFIYIAVATLITTGVISALKHLTTLPCPQSLLKYGGHNRWVTIWQMFSSKLPAGNCFPAGHASGGYAWLCLAFVFPYLSKSFYWMLLPGTFLGLTFGIAQQFRGAHFLSHDLLTIALSWLSSAIIFYCARCSLNLWPKLLKRRMEERERLSRSDCDYRTE